MHRCTKSIFSNFQTLVWGAVVGIIIGVCVAFPVLVLATTNVIVGSFAAFNIACISVCVIGIIPMAGCKFQH